GLRLVIIDPFAAAIGDANHRRRNQVARILDELAEFARRRNLAVVIVNATDPVSAGRTGPDWVDVLPYLNAAARAIWTIEFDSETGHRKWLASRTNFAALPDGLGFAIDRKTGCVAWEDEPLALAGAWPAPHAQPR